MRHIHLDSCPSTQVFLKDLIESEGLIAPTLVSTANQTQGQGRRGNSWIFLQDSLAFSFTISPHPILTLSSLEIGILIIQFFETLGVVLKLKWPNDLMSEKGEKCGGIIQHYIHKQLIVGVGINLSNQIDKSVKLDIPIGAIDLKISSQQIKNLPLDMVNYISNNRLNEKEVQQRFKKYHLYHEKKVKIHDEDQITEGIFNGIGANGEALLLLSSGELKKVLTGTLRLSII